MIIIPAIDIINGKCVRLVQGDFEKKKEYTSDPVELAKSYEAAGVQNLHMVDLDGARQKKVVNLNILESIANQTQLRIDFGGGVQSDADIKSVFDAGASQVTGGSIAVTNRELFEKWMARYGPEKMILGADVKNRKIAISGWQQTSDMELLEFLKYYLSIGVEYVICTDVEKDGLLKGPSFGLYKHILDTFPDIKLIASGGISELQDVIKLRHMGVHGAIIGKALYEGRITLRDLKNLL